MRADPTAAPLPEIPLKVEFADNLSLRGFDRPTYGTSSLYLTLYWQARAAPQADYRTELTLLDAQGNLRLRWLSHPANGRFPTRAWDAGDLVRDTLIIPLAGVPTGDYRLELCLLDDTDTPLTSTQGESIVITDLSLPDFSASNRPMIWQNGRSGGDMPVYRYRATIPVTAVAQSEIMLIDPNGQSKWPVSVSGGLYLFMVDYRWPSGKYDLHFNGADTGQKLQVNNFDWNFTPPAMSYTVNANFNNDLLLLGYDLPQRRVKAGDGVPLVLYWQSLHQQPEA